MVISLTTIQDIKNYLATIASEIYKCLRSIGVMLNRDIFHPLCYGNKSCQRLSELVNERALEYAKSIMWIMCSAAILTAQPMS